MWESVFLLCCFHGFLLLFYPLCWCHTILITVAFYSKIYNLRLFSYCWPGIEKAHVTFADWVNKWRNELQSNHCNCCIITSIVYSHLATWARMVETIGIPSFCHCPFWNTLCMSPSLSGHLSLQSLWCVHICVIVCSVYYPLEWTKGP